MNVNGKKKKESYSKLLKDGNLQIIFGITLMAVLGVSSITPAFPKIREELNISIEKVGLLITFFTVPGVLLSLFFGVLSDRLGRKIILVPALFLFSIAGSLCFFVHDFNFILLFRFLQGVGAASLGSMINTLIGDLYKDRERIAALGYNAGIISIGTAGYPLIGGILATFSWHYPFLLPLFAIPIGFLVLFKLKNPEPVAQENLKDYLGNTFKRIFTKKVIGLFLISILTFSILYGPYLTYFPFLLADKFKAPPYLIGIVLSTASLASAITSLFIGHISRSLGVIKLLVISTCLYMVSMVLAPIVNQLYLFLIPATFFGIAQAFNYPAVQSMLASVGSINQRGAIMSINGMVLRGGQTLGPIIVVPLYNWYGINGVFYGGVILALFMSVVILTMIRK